MISRVIVIVLDGFGVGELPDADRYGDEGSHTLNHIARAVGGLSLPNLERLGLGQLGNLRGDGPDRDATAQVGGAFGKMTEVSAGKDTTTGHWEMMGLVTERPFPTYPKGFPPDLIHAFEAAIGRKSIGNVVASGTEILKTLGEEHVRTGFPIVYTSADSVFQIAAHEELVPLDQLYSMCLKARSILTGEHAVGRVIARPFIGAGGAAGFSRTYHRRDFAVQPSGETVLDRLHAAGLHVVGLGKIEDIFSGRGLTEAIHTEGNGHGMQETIRCVEGPGSGLIFTNLVDFDMLYGHRNDAVGYAKALEDFDRQLGELMARMRDGDLLMLTSDHGNDPVTPSTDHSREYVPIMAWGRWMTGPVNLGVRATFADLGQTVLEAFHLAPLARGTSYLSSLVRVPVKSGRQA